MAILSLRPQTVEALREVLQAERDHHLRLAAFSESSEKRLMACGVVKWLEDWISGGLLERRSAEAMETLGVAGETGAPSYDDGGSPYMEGDGLPEDWTDE